MPLCYWSFETQVPFKARTIMHRSAEEHCISKGFESQDTKTSIICSIQAKARQHQSDPQSYPCHTCIQPLSKMTCISSTRQYSPSSFSLVSFSHFVTLLCTIRSLNHGVVNHLNIRLCQILAYIRRGDMTAFDEWIALYAVMLYPTCTAGLRKMPFVADNGLSA